ncbi:hypothetical protein PRIPAC_80561 [Pristionchus pacificus]|uniref:G protein-coupled receptor n=1 Tax=Pristionchus pacificus TaxID=54126 RepID=A0A2A6CNA2_PRIPA|nr:hypothetical protein PRIPAC_80561 [Pristionchus pacificus]|eukprot:PDM79715.1 G protein-coupled receptor [Pristionchus pacificus]
MESQALNLQLTISASFLFGCSLYLVNLIIGNFFPDFPSTSFIVIPICNLQNVITAMSNLYVITPYRKFGTICTFQMICDIAKLFVTTAFALIPDDLSPGPHSEIAITVAEIFYFSSCLMHVLFAIHRLIFIVFPNRRDAWTSYTVHAIAVCVAFASFKSFLPRWLDENLYVYFNREVMAWLFTKTPSTVTYMNFKMYLSYTEIVVVIILDSISFTRLHMLKAEIANSIREANSSAEVKLVIQSLLQCWPTLTLVVFYFHILPRCDDAFLKFLCCLTWNISNAMDGMIIIMLHTRRVLFFKQKSAIGTSTVRISTMMPSTLN